MPNNQSSARGRGWVYVGRGSEKKRPPIFLVPSEQPSAKALGTIMGKGQV
jgi:hypothetical protein